MAVKATWQKDDKKVEFQVGDKIRLLYWVEEAKGKRRTQPFEGTIIGIRGRNENKTFTIRRIATDNVGVERIIPLNSPWIESIEVVRRPQRKVRRAKLYYLRQARKRKHKRLL